ncbi:hypothetical protein [Sphingomonas solaris]|uniref:Uncharacterized protein n=1 Tax=Alterirhizorhabdus solaris TaxID=2529389 RepID=A0A558RB99_9SPHN|nr:hypothetical protein [Sphingomonas solaris]TVV76631.1 hypothetical protein FOY91_03635 [Sphingomonas solaris]
MDAIATYKGTLLNHLETVYRPGERDVAIALVEALGCTITDTGFASDRGETFLAVHPNADDRDRESNVFYMSPMTAEQEAIETRLAHHVAADASLRDGVSAYRGKAHGRPFGIPHFALRYPSVDAVEAVAARLERLAAAGLGERLHLRIFRPEEADSARGRLIQGFVHQDVIVAGSFMLGQLIELQTKDTRG